MRVDSPVDSGPICRSGRQVDSFSIKLRKTSNLLFYLGIAVDRYTHNPHLEMLGKPVYPSTRTVGTV